MNPAVNIAISRYDEMTRKWLEAPKIPIRTSGFREPFGIGDLHNGIVRACIEPKVGPQISMVEFLASLELSQSKSDQ